MLGGMPSAGFAPATSPTRAIVGPVNTSFGFRSWYLACFSDVIMAVPQSFSAAVAFAYSNESRPIVFGILRQLIADLITGPGRRLRQERPATLSRMPESKLRSKPNVAISVSQIRSISFKSGMMARLNLERDARDHHRNCLRYKTNLRRVGPGLRQGTASSSRCIHTSADSFDIRSRILTAFFAFRFPRNFG